MPNPTPCKSCGEPIIFVQTANKRSMPLNAKTDQNGRLWIDDNGIVRMIPSNRDPDDYADADQRYTSHYATCPHAALHRKKR